MGQLKVKDLKKLVDQQMKLGNGDKYIVISDDNDGNGFHGLFYGFTDDEQSIDDILKGSILHETTCEEVEKIILLG